MLCQRGCTNAAKSIVVAAKLNKKKNPARHGKELENRSIDMTESDGSWWIETKAIRFYRASMRYSHFGVDISYKRWLRWWSFLLNPDKGTKALPPFPRRVSVFELVKQG